MTCKTCEHYRINQYICTRYPRVNVGKDRWAYPTQSPNDSCGEYSEHEIHSYENAITPDGRALALCAVCGYACFLVGHDFDTDYKCKNCMQSLEVAALNCPLHADKRHVFTPGIDYCVNCGMSVVMANKQPCCPE